MNKEQKKFEEVIKGRRNRAKRMRRRAQLDRRGMRWMPLSKKPVLRVITVPWYKRVWRWITRFV